MKKHNWLDLSENLLFVASAAGALASVAFQQVGFVAVPLPFFMLSNLMNRRRMEQSTLRHTTTSIFEFNQKLTGEMQTLRQQASSLPTLADISGVKKMVLQKNKEVAGEIRREIAKRLSQFEEQSVKRVELEVEALKSQTTHLAETLETATNQLYRLSLTTRLEGMEGAIVTLKAETAKLQTKLQTLSVEAKPNLQPIYDDINHLHRRFNNLPAPFDANALKQDVESLIKLVGDLVPRRELSRYAAELGMVQQQQQTLEQSVMPIRMAVSIFKKQLDELTNKLKEGTLGKAAPEPEAIVELRVAIAALEQRLNQPAPSPSEPVDPYVEMLAALNSLPQLNGGALEAEPVLIPASYSLAPEERRELRNLISRLPQLLDTTALQKQLKYLSSRVDGVESGMAGLQGQTKETGHMADLVSTLRAVGHYDLVFAPKLRSSVKKEADSASGNRALLLSALKQSQEHLIIVLPWLNQDNFDPDLVQNLKDFLDRQGRIEIGLGHLGDINQGYAPRCADTRWVGDAAEKAFVYNALSHLTQLKRDYPKQFKFKILGTVENFLICDSTSAILSVNNLSSISTDFSEVEVGLQTTDPQVIENLLDRFNNPTISENDIAAYFNRATTRHEIGDLAGAIGDYTYVLQRHPDDDLAYNNRGLAYHEMGNKQEAIADFDQTLELNPSCVIAYCNRGCASADLGDKLGSIEDFSHAIRLDPDCATAYFYRGMARTHLGNKGSAIVDYSEVIRIDANSAVAYFYRGLARMKIGDNQKAIEDLQTAAKLYVAQGNKTNYLKAMAALKGLKRNATHGSQLSA